MKEWNKNNIKAVFFDIDGTLFSHTQKKIPESTLESLDKLRKNGILIFLATGRSLAELDKMSVGDIPFDGYVTMNGHMCYNRKRELVHSLTMEKEDCDILVKLFNEKALAMSIVEEDRMYLNYVDDMVRQIHDDITTEVIPIGEYNGADIYQFILYYPSEECGKWLEGTKKCKIHYWHPMAGDVLHGDSGKAASIEIILPFYDLMKEEIMVIGDGENDIDMIEYAGVGVAMGNADDKVKEHADYITTHIDQDGIKNALEHYNLI